MTVAFVGSNPTRAGRMADVPLGVLMMGASHTLGIIGGQPSNNDKEDILWNNLKLEQ